MLTRLFNVWAISEPLANCKRTSNRVLVQTWRGQALNLENTESREAASSEVTESRIYAACWCDMWPSAAHVGACNADTTHPLRFSFRSYDTAMMMDAVG